jgi:hypothetical protein
MDIKRQLTEIVSKQLGWPMDEKTLEKNHSIIWQNVRKKSQGGLKLTDTGFQIFKDLVGFKSYDVEFPKELVISNKVSIWMDRFIDSPYYICKSSIVVFKEKTALQLILFSGDVEKFGLAKVMSQDFLKNN